MRQPKAGREPRGKPKKQTLGILRGKPHPERNPRGYYGGNAARFQGDIHNGKRFLALSCRVTLRIPFQFWLGTHFDPEHKRHENVMQSSCKHDV
eukprot:375711-Amorphochlora_amoeboformis.AAC.4